MSWLFGWVSAHFRFSNIEIYDLIKTLEFKISVPVMFMSDSATYIPYLFLRGCLKKSIAYSVNKAEQLCPLKNKTFSVELQYGVISSDIKGASK
jgi:hypothetical protein